MAIPLLGTALLDETFPLPVSEPFTLQQALDAGLSRHRLRVLEKVGLVRRIIKGAYVAVQVPDSVTLRTHALRLLVPENAVVTDWTACWLWTGIDVPGAHHRDPEVTVFRPAGHDRLRNGLCASGERTFSRGDVWHLDGLAVTSPIRTAWDLGRLAPRDYALGALDALLRHGTFTLDELLEGVERFKGMRGVVQLRALAPLADPRSESPGESLLRLRWLDLVSLPPPTPQVPILLDGVEIYRVDLGVEELRYGCEYDGANFHTADDQPRDRARREDLSNRFSWDVDAVRRRNVSGPERDVERILYDGIVRARKALGRPTYLL